MVRKAQNPLFCWRNLPLLAVVLLFVICFPTEGLATDSEDIAELHRLRSDRRHSAKNVQSQQKSVNAPARFGLLVIPVDFSDQRLPSDWNPLDNLSTRIFGSQGHTLENYFDVASDGKMALEITIAPLVPLAGARRTYSDVGLAGFTRTRAMATEAITAVADQGLEFRRLDMDGPDGIPGSDDDDGQVDGVLILHSAPGQENDPALGLIQPLQFFIEPPVESGGVQAAFYAVASLQSGLGIWAHETGHLLGMEDRYDPLLHPESGGVDVRSLGGLGKFSLMASGAWGTGDGNNPALPDAYTCWQLGWTSIQRFPQAGNPPCTVSAWRGQGLPPVQVWSAGPLESEFYLMEARDPQATFPFDGGIPAGQMLIYHVDETVPDGWYISDDDTGYHLRARLVEADHDFALKNGEDDGRSEDLFPGPLSVNMFTPFTLPGSAGYTGPSGISMENITASGSSVTFDVSDSEAEFVLDLEFQVMSGPETQLILSVRSLGLPISELSCTISVSGEGGGHFPGGAFSQNVLLSQTSGIWSPIEAVYFEAPDQPAEGAITTFHFQFLADGQNLPVETLPWVWTTKNSIFDFQQPGWTFWEQTLPNDVSNTQWHLWNQAPFLTADGTAVLACTGEEESTSANWPNVQYGRRGRAALISPAVGDDLAGIQLTHAVEVEFLHAGAVMDGAAVFWQAPDGSTVPALPVDGWDAVISTESDNSLGGSSVFADSMLVLDDGFLPQWRCDVLPLPTSGQGPWRLRLEFSSNYLWRWRGWFVAKMEPVSQIPESAFPVQWQKGNAICGAGLQFDAPFPGHIFDNPVVEFFDPARGGFFALDGQEIHLAHCNLRYLLPRRYILDQLHPLGLTRHLLRVVFLGPQGKVASRSIVVYPDEGARAIGYLEQPFPNPSTGSIKFLVEVPEGQQANLKVYDLRGRLVHKQNCSAGRYQIFWNGLDDQGRPLAAGNYYLKLEGSSFSSMRKVVLIR